MNLSLETVIVTCSYSIVAVISAALLMLVLWEAAERRSNQLFTLTMFFLCTYSILNIFGRFIESLNLNPRSLFYLTALLYTAFTTTLFFFAAEFAELKGPLVLPIKLAAVIAAGLALYATFTDQMAEAIIPLNDDSGGYTYRYGPLFGPVMIAHFVYLAFAIYSLSRAQDTRAKMLLPAVVLIPLGTLSLALRPIIQLPLQAVFLALSAYLMGRTILRHQLFNPLAALNEKLTATNAELENTNVLLTETSRLKSQFLANMSHELRTPLNSIIGYTELVLDHVYGPLNERQEERLHRVIRNGRHLLGLINDILDLSKIEAGRMVLELENIASRDLIESVLTTIEPLAAEKNLVIVRELEKAPLIRADLTRARQVFVNLLSNAVKFTEVGSITIHADTTDNDGMAHFSVADTGIGIALDQFDTIFEEFRQVDGSTTREFQGTGLGLAITRKLIELHGGSVWVESAVGAGSTFHVTFPGILASPATVEADKATQTQPASRRPRILVVNDNLNALITIRDTLVDQGYEILSAVSGLESVERALEGQPDLIMLDMNLTGVLDSWQTLQLLKGDGKTAHIPLLMVALVNGEVRAFSLSVDGIVAKPMESESVLSVVQRTLDGQWHAPILVVDDNEDDRTLLNALLSSAGYEVVSAEGGQVACEWLKQHTASLIILDLMMPDLSGFDVLRFIRHDLAIIDTPVLVISARDLTTEEELLLHQQCATLLEKGDLAQDVLFAEVKELLQHDE